jgi:hypothetical protein
VNVARSVVRIFTDPTAPGSSGTATAIELGRGFTDANGQCEIDLSPTE